MMREAGRHAAGQYGTERAGPAVLVATAAAALLLLGRADAA